MQFRLSVKRYKLIVLHVGMDCIKFTICKHYLNMENTFNWRMIKGRVVSQQPFCGKPVTATHRINARNLQCSTPVTEILVSDIYKIFVAQELKST